VQKLVVDNPALTEFRFTLESTHNNLGWVFDQIRKWSEAEAQYRLAVGLFQNLADDNPAVTGFQRNLAIARYRSKNWTSHRRLGRRRSHERSSF
jgi:hypothetical protein